ncbi:hypothetical protein ACHQM5_000996 [Ranunculus cassubicifolius]
MLALRAVQRHIAASRSTNPWRSLQHFLLEGVPITMLINPLSTFPQTPNCRTSRGQLREEGVVGVGGFGTGAGGVLGVVGVGVVGGLGALGGGFGLGDGVGFVHGLQGGGGHLVAVIRERKRRLSARKRVADA